ncbi:MAG: MoxR family ATPase [Gemmatimonadetes bacterium]|nr:MoxR family ATPase [Gemmatimonadota bacterium]
MNPNESQDVQAVADLKVAHDKILAEVRKVVIGQTEVVEDLLIAILANGHCLLIGVPGLAKTLLVSTVAKVLDLDFSRIQFTPDLMPSDITGTDVLETSSETGHRDFRFIQGPVFANIVLADEINRTPPKTQAALLQAMQEREVTAGGNTYPLEPPFFVLATQNPIEQEGTYPLPEAQLDRFMFSVHVDYPKFDEEARIVEETTSAYQADLQTVLGAEEILRLQGLVRRVPVSRDIVNYAVKLVSATRPRSDDAPQFIKDWVSWGAGPRASQYLVLGAKTRAILAGRFTPVAEDVRSVARAVLRHRIVTNFNAEAEGVDPVDIVDRLTKEITPREAATA